jgi:acyl carrier protein
MDKTQILAELKGHLQKLFQIEPTSVSLETHLYTDLKLDSIDAVDLVVHLQRVTGKKINPEQFKQVRTVGDVVDAIYELLNAPPEESKAPPAAE